MIQVEYLGIDVIKENYTPTISFKLRVKSLMNNLLLMILSSDDVVKINGRIVGYAQSTQLRAVESEEKEVDTRLAIPHDVLERIERSRKAKGKIELSITYRPRIMVVKEGKVDLAEDLKRFVAKKIVKEIYYIPVFDTMDLVQLVCPVIDPRTNSKSIKLTTEEWLDTLSKVGYRKCRVIEVPAINGDGKIKPILEELDKAWRLMAENYPESLNACRKALEEIKKYMINLGFESNGKIDFKKIYGGEKFGEFMNKIFRSLWGLTDIGSHTGRSKMTTASDVEFVITSIYMLLKSLLEATRQ